MKVRLTVALSLVLALPATASAASLPSVSSGARPGPDILYEPPATAPQLTNSGVWKADPILVSGATSYRDGEFVYQDFLYDDHGANGGQRDPNDPRSGDDTFSGPNGTYTYPTDQKRYAQNAADLVELRVRPLADATAFRITLNTMLDPTAAATTIAIGTSATPRDFPHGANAKAPAQLFLTVHGDQADLVDAATGNKAAGPAPTATVDRERRQVTVLLPHAAYDPGAGTVRLAAGVGLWDTQNNKYLVLELQAAMMRRAQPTIRRRDIGTEPTLLRLSRQAGRSRPRDRRLRCRSTGRPASRGQSCGCPSPPSAGFCPAA